MVLVDLRAQLLAQNDWIWPSENSLSNSFRSILRAKFRRRIPLNPLLGRAQPPPPLSTPSKGQLLESDICRNTLNNRTYVENHHRQRRLCGGEEVEGLRTSWSFFKAFKLLVNCIKTVNPFGMFWTRRCLMYIVQCFFLSSFELIFPLRSGSTVHCIYVFSPPWDPGQRPGQKPRQKSGQQLSKHRNKNKLRKSNYTQKENQRTPRTTRQNTQEGLQKT